MDDKLHYCSVCDKAFGNDWGLQRHLATPLHAKKLAKRTGHAAATTSCDVGLDFAFPQLSLFFLSFFSLEDLYAYFLFLSFSLTVAEYFRDEEGQDGMLTSLSFYLGSGH
jgi:hypothetical protein